MMYMSLNMIVILTVHELSIDSDGKSNKSSPMFLFTFL